jgi:hypothetical protein
MRAILFVLTASICALAQASVSAEAPGGPTLRFARVQQETSYQSPAWSEEQQCLVLARRLIARAAPHQSANVTQDELKTLSDEICAE